MQQGAGPGCQRGGVGVSLECGGCQPTADTDCESSSIQPSAYLVRGYPAGGHESYVRKRAEQSLEAIRPDQACGNSFTARAPTARACITSVAVNTPVAVGIRPEDIEDASLATAGGQARRMLDVVVELREGLGSEVVAYARLDAQAPDVQVAQRDPEATLTGGRGVELVARLDPRTAVAIDVRATFAVNVDRLHFFGVATTQAIRT